MTLAPAYKAHLGALKARAPEVHWDVLPDAAAGESTADGLVAAGEQVLARVQAILQGKPHQAVLFQVIVGEDDALAALTGLLKSASRENPKLVCQVIGMPHTAGVTDLIRATEDHASPAVARDAEVRYTGGTREVRVLEELPDTGAEALPWKDGGVYLITGGAGGLASIIANEIAQRVRGAGILLAGRSAPSEALQAQLDAWNKHGTQIAYRVLDVTAGPAVDECVAELLDRHGSLSGVIHCAGVIHDNFIIKKCPEELRAVIAPKVAGAVHLDRATRDLTLDCFLLFSSAAAVFGVAGQSDYALANAFLDRFAAQRDAQVTQGRRRGRTLSINWPLWDRGGMQMDEVSREAMHRHGFEALSTADGITALYRAWASRAPQVVVVRGERQAAQALVNELRTSLAAPVHASGEVAVEAPVAPGALEERTLHRLRRMLGEVTKLGTEKIDAREPFQSYGIDSFMVAQMNLRLAKIFSDLSKTLLYEYPTLAQLGEYLVRDHRAACVRWTGSHEPASPPPASNPAPERTQRAHKMAPTKAPRDGIAIIGMTGRYPRARTLLAYWENLQSGKDCIADIPVDRWPLDGFFEPDVEQAIEGGKSYCKWGGFLEGFAEFDPLFFNISPREAADIDPQERLFLQAAWEVLEDAGYTRARLQAQHRGRVGVYVGITKTGFSLYGPALWQAGGKAYPHTSFASVANRVSYLLDLHGPSMPIDTMCSASLTAIHEACEHLERGECELAIAGGVNLYLHPSSFQALCAQRMLSRDGRCKSFGAGANGFVPGEGVGALLLKPLQRAIGDRDPIHGVIRGTSVNHGGKTNGYTVPSPAAQGELVAAALHKAGIHPRTVGYIEAHGTGTELGDPIEITGLAQAFSGSTKDRQFCAIGSAKSNIGHLESAAGIAGVTKVLLQMKHRTLVPSLHTETLNPLIDFARTPFRVQQTASEWPRPVVELDGMASEYPRIAGVSSFGAGGANAHVIVEEYVDQEAGTGAVPSRAHPALVVLSAKTEAQLRDQAERLLAHVSAAGNADLFDIAYTLQVGREAMEHRLAFTAATIDELRDKLSAHLAGTLGDLEECYRGTVKNHKDTLAVFHADEALQHAVASWIEQGKYARLLEMWVKGLAVDWETLYGDRSAYPRIAPRRISVPTYPFARERYWIEVPDAAPPARRRDESPGASSLLFLEDWVDAASDAPLGAEPRTLVVLLSDRPWQRAIATELRRIRASVNLAFIERGEAGDAELAGDDELARYRVVRGDVRSHVDAFRQIVERWGAPDVVWDFAGLEDPADLEDPGVIVDVLQGVAGANIDQLKVLLAGEYRTALERCYLESWIGFERSVQRALPKLQVALVHAARTGTTSRQWIDRLWRESRADKLESSLYLGDQRQVLRCREDRSATPAGAAALRRGGTYLITGGLGGLGYLFAQQLARHWSANLILTGRSVLDAGGQAKLDALASLGGRALYVTADAGDQPQMRAALERGRERFGELAGVIHAAGVASSASLLAQTRSSTAAVWTPKITGTVVLGELLESRDLDFVCCFSSSAAMLGDFGSCDYAVGSRFQLAYAKYMTGRALAICWPLWADGGMRLTDDATRLYLESSGQRALPAAEGVALFEQLLARQRATGLRHGLVMAGDRGRVSELLGVSAPTRVERPRSGADGQRSTRERVLAELKDQVSELQKIPGDKLDVGANLVDFGFDSVGLVALAKRLSARFAIALLPSVFFSHATLQQLADYLVAEHADAVERHRGDRDVPRSSEAPAPAPTAAPAVAPKRAAGDELIAIVGMSGRASGARNIEDMWRILAGGEDAIQEIPLSRFDWRELYQAVGETEASAATAPGKTCSKWMGIVPGVEEFDAAFFEVSPREARTMDPRQRLLLQEAFIALEDAGFGAAQLARDTVGMFVGVEQGDYQLLVGQEGSVTGNHDAILASRLSYFLDLRGPVMAINTACSSGLVALHQACASLRAGECDAAIAAGVNLILTPVSYLGMSQAGMLSPTGTCAAFDRRANGLVPGEAVMAVVLKRLSQAEADGDRIHAVIPGSGVNYDGKTNGLTAPSGVAQTDLIKRVHARAGVSAGAIEYIVTHGTGTRLGDPVEIHALRDAFGRGERSSCALTSTKTNFGHTFAASGLVSLVSLVQALRHETIPASLHCDQPSDYIDWPSTPFYVCTQNRPWPRTEGRSRFGAVSAFGMSGTNAHVVVESYDAQDRSPCVETPYYLLALSAKTESALARRIRDLVALLQDPGHTWHGPALAAMSHTLLNHRQHFAHRYAVIAANRDQAVSLLEQAGAAERPSMVLRGTVARELVEQPELRAAAKRSLEELSVQRTAPALYRQSLVALGELYCQGYQLDWHALFGAPLPRPTALPAYPFSADRHWITGERPISAVPVVREDALKPVTEVAMPFDEPEETEAKPQGIALRSLHEVASSEGFVSDEVAPRNEEAFVSKDAPPPMDAVPPKDVAPPSARVSLRELEQELRVSLAKALYAQPDEIGPDAPFNELGLDSIIGVEWVRTLNADYGLSLSATTLYAHPTIRELASWLAPQISTASAAPVAHDPPAAAPIPSVAPSRAVVERSVPSAERKVPAAVAPVVEPVAAPAFNPAREPIAIVGMSGRYPGARDLATYWQNLAEGKNCVEPIPASRWSIEDYYDPEPGKPGKTYCKWLGRLDDVECFDSLFFNISPAEAQTMDPQQRLFLEESYKAFQNAGYTAQRLNSRKCGVYLGIIHGDYGLLLQQSRQGLGDATGNSAAIAAARIAYYLNLKGPAISIDTACSGSLVATHLACQALRAGEIEMALVGGVTLYLAPQSYIGMCAAGMLSPDGRCKTFDNSADGFVPGEGVGTLVLKRLRDAEADGDLIHGVIIGSGINQDGKTNGITAPSLGSQMELVREIYARYDIHPESISYVEMHGTGTKLGDPIELEALATAYRERTQRAGYCAIGSVKSNIGHTSAAAGMAGVHKVLLALQHGELPATLSFRTPNEHFDFTGSPFRVNRECSAWPAGGAVRRAAVSSFGYSGTNAHVVIEEYRGPARVPSRGNAREEVVIVLSARNRDRLHEQARLLRAHLEQPSTTDADLAAIAYTLQVGRDAMEHRLALVADSKERAVRALRAFLDQDATEVFVGQIGKTEGVSLLDSDEDAGDLIETWLRKRKLKQLAQVWVRGLAVEWSRLYPDGAPTLVRLPVYPFARQRHWVEASAPVVARVQRSSSTLSGQEFFLRDHVVNGRKLLPAVCYLELARAAMDASPGRRGARVRLQDVVWLEPLAVDETSKVHVTLHTAKDDEVELSISTHRPGDSATPVVHAQGRAMWVDATFSEPISVDLDALRRRCDRAIDVARCYEAFRTMGIAYGPAHRGLTSIHAGTDADGRPLVIAQVMLPACASETRDQYVLHPSVLDSALQAGIGLAPEGPSAGTVALPFAVDGVDILDRSPDVAWVVVRPSASRAAEGMTKLDVDVCDPAGRVCVRLTGFTSRTTTRPPSARIEQPQPQPVSSDRLRAPTIAALKKLAGQVLKLPAHDLDEHEPLEKYGIDSILVVKLTKGLKAFFPELSSTLFFEHRTIAAAAEHFIHSDEAAVRRWVGLEHRPEPEPARLMNGHAPAVTIVEARAVVVAPAPSTQDGIAIIGMSGRYPGARDVREYWDNLKAGRSSIREIPAERWDHRRYYDPQKGKLGKSYSKWGGFIEDIDMYDPLFFRISPKEAEQMDPQERLFLQEAYASIEDAGYTPAGL
ncbi:MAG TPA: SDR family NAD(P)-dependent oxidoreductase, partial [Kofleriaceae bacterium]|nr:SDR family NAD(P)-dependent oxidoreductase [Kofleriaceae bacterium]